MSGKEPLQRKESFLLDVRGITKNFGGLRALDSVSLQIEAGKLYSIVGPNGAGKTTLFNILTGFLRADEGQIIYGSVDITKIPSHRRVQLGIARSFQNLRLFLGLTVLENVLLGLQQRQGESAFGALFKRWGSQEESSVKEALSFLEMVGLSDRAYETAGSLSYPEQKLLALARLFATEAELILLDEPTSGVDRRWFDKILSLLRSLVDERGKTVCVIEHNLDLIREASDWIFFLDQGRLIAGGTPDSIMNNPELARIYFGGGI